MWWREVNYLGASVSRTGGGDQGADASPELASALEDPLCAYFAVQSPPARHNCGAQHNSLSPILSFFYSFSLFVIQRLPFFDTSFFSFFGPEHLLEFLFKIFCIDMHSCYAVV